MKMHVGRPLLATATLLLATVAAGCVSYSPAQLSAMSAVDLCETEYMQRPNLSAETKRAIQSELQRRNDNCRNHATAVAQRYEEFMYRKTYGKADSPPQADAASALERGLGAHGHLVADANFTAGSARHQRNRESGLPLAESAHQGFHDAQVSLAGVRIRMRRQAARLGFGHIEFDLADAKLAAEPSLFFPCADAFDRDIRPEAALVQLGIR